MEKIRKRSFTQYEAIQPFFVDQTNELSQIEEKQFQNMPIKKQVFSQKMKFRILNMKKEKFFNKKLKNSRNSQRSNEKFSTIESLKKQALAIQTASFLSSRFQIKKEESTSEQNTPLSYVPKDQFNSTKRISLIESFRQKLKILNQRTKQKNGAQIISLQINQIEKVEKTRRRYLSQKHSCTSLTASRFYRTPSVQQKNGTKNEKKVLCQGIGYKRTKKQSSQKSKNTL